MRISHYKVKHKINELMGGLFLTVDERSQGC